ncbi:hypothetical protein Tco_1451243, partial [Tanacetum coccineum]
MDYEYNLKAEWNMFDEMSKRKILMGSEFARLNYEGFYTIILDKDDVISCVASVRCQDIILLRNAYYGNAVGTMGATAMFQLLRIWFPHALPKDKSPENKEIGATFAAERSR